MSTLIPCDLIHLAVTCLKIVGEKKQVDAFTKEFANQFHSDIDHFVTRHQGELNQGQEDAFIRVLFTIGEFVLSLGFEGISSSALTAIQAITTNAVYREGTHLKISTRLRATALVTFGKVCLSKEQVAKKGGIEILVAHLNPKEPEVIQANILVLLKDLCVQYTGLVDRFIPVMTHCLCHSDARLRRLAVMVLSSLLAEDYIKFKGSIVFRFLFALCDRDLEIRTLVEAVFTRLVITRQPQLMKTIFPETICVLNGFTRHPSFKGALGNKDFSLQSHASRREMVYR